MTLEQHFVGRFGRPPYRHEARELVVRVLSAAQREAKSEDGATLDQLIRDALSGQAELDGEAQAADVDEGAIKTIIDAYYAEQQRAQVLTMRRRRRLLYTLGGAVCLTVGVALLPTAKKTARAQYVLLTGARMEAALAAVIRRYNQQADMLQREALNFQAKEAALQDRYFGPMPALLQAEPPDQGRADGIQIVNAYWLNKARRARDSYRDIYDMRHPHGIRIKAALWFDRRSRRTRIVVTKQITDPGGRERLHAAYAFSYFSPASDYYFASVVPLMRKVDGAVFFQGGQHLHVDATGTLVVVSVHRGGVQIYYGTAGASAYIRRARAALHSFQALFERGVVAAR